MLTCAGDILTCAPKTPAQVNTSQSARAQVNSARTKVNPLAIATRHDHGPRSLVNLSSSSIDASSSSPSESLFPSASPGSKNVAHGSARSADSFPTIEHSRRWRKALIQPNRPASAGTQEGEAQSETSTTISGLSREKTRPSHLAPNCLKRQSQMTDSTPGRNTEPLDDEIQADVEGDPLQPIIDSRLPPSEYHLGGPEGGLLTDPSPKQRKSLPSKRDGFDSNSDGLNELDSESRGPSDIVPPTSRLKKLSPQRDGSDSDSSELMELDPDSSALTELDYDRDSPDSSDKDKFETEIVPPEKVRRIAEMRIQGYTFLKKHVFELVILNRTHQYCSRVIFEVHDMFESPRASESYIRGNVYFLPGDYVDPPLFGEEPPQRAAPREGAEVFWWNPGLTTEDTTVTERSFLVDILVNKIRHVVGNSNHPSAKIYWEDVHTLIEEQNKGIISLPPIHIALISPPCQGFSSANPGGKDDAENRALLSSVGTIARSFRPYWMCIENVPGMTHPKNLPHLRKLQVELLSLGYVPEWVVHCASSFGVPQTRRRVILYATLRGLTRPEFPHITHAWDSPTLSPVVTLRQAIHDLNHENPRIHNDRGNPEYPRPAGGETEYSRMLGSERTTEITYHATGHGRSSEKTESWPQARWDEPSSTVRTLPGSRWRCVHPDGQRVFTVRECLRIQSFPDDWKLSVEQYRQVGNAVPPLLSEAWARQVRNAILTDYPELEGQFNGSRDAANQSKASELRTKGSRGSKRGAEKLDDEEGESARVKRARRSGNSL
ncbi:S-adenosyl-L-methionine-dependent methyltransferase [Mycena crocata]|nr:S-adenosyl-L-methionine-dependent methyltransferase [Mycena crocata]